MPSSAWHRCRSFHHRPKLTPVKLFRACQCRRNNLRGEEAPSAPPSPPGAARPNKGGSAGSPLCGTGRTRSEPSARLGLPAQPGPARQPVGRKRRLRGGGRRPGPSPPSSPPLRRRSSALSALPSRRRRWCLSRPRLLAALRGFASLLSGGSRAALPRTVRARCSSARGRKWLRPAAPPLARGGPGSGGGRDPALPAPAGVWPRGCSGTGAPRCPGDGRGRAPAGGYSRSRPALPSPATLPGVGGRAAPGGDGAQPRAGGAAGGAPLAEPASPPASGAAAPTPSPRAGSRRSGKGGLARLERLAKWQGKAYGPGESRWKR